MDDDPPRRPPERPNSLFRHKTYHGPGRRKRGREVLEDITYIVNEARNWRLSPAGAMADRAPALADATAAARLGMMGLAISPNGRSGENEDEEDELEARADGRVLRVHEVQYTLTREESH